jgi:endoglucanase
MYPCTQVFFLALVSATCSGHAQTAPAKPATGARLDLMAEPAVRALASGEIPSGNGTVERMNWVPEAERARSYTVQFPITHLAWSECALRFAPEGSGSVTLSLTGPWEEASPGAVYREGVFWDAFQVTGASVIGNSSQEWPARVWHNEPLRLRLKVTAKIPVTVLAKARADVPPDHPEMRRLTDRTTPAHQAARKFLRGTNLGNYLEAQPGQDWSAKYSEADFVHIKAEGFDHVRLPIAWHHYAGSAPDFPLSDDIYAKADVLVTHALKNGLNVVVNIHHFDEFTSNPLASANKFCALWRQIAAHYSKFPDDVAFELLNEPKDAATTVVINPIYAEAIRVIRETNPRRVLFVGPGKWNQVSELPNLRLPDKDDNLIVTVHCYEPFNFTHQGATWTSSDVKGLKGIVFPGPPSKPFVPDPATKLGRGTLDWLERYNTLPTDKNPCSPLAFRRALQQAREWSEQYGRPVHVGEFGCYTAADASSRARFYAEFRKALDEFGLGWAMWDWKAGFRYWDDKTGQPAPGMRAALFVEKK